MKTKRGRQGRALWFHVSPKKVGITVWLSYKHLKTEKIPPSMQPKKAMLCNLCLVLSPLFWLGSEIILHITHCACTFLLYPLSSLTNSCFSGNTFAQNACVFSHSFLYTPSNTNAQASTSHRWPSWFYKYSASSENSIFNPRIELFEALIFY